MTTDDYVLKIGELNQSLRLANRRLTEATKEMDRIWARIEIEKLTFEIRSLLDKLEKRTLGRK